jgi:hypothetical protein
MEIAIFIITLPFVYVIYKFSKLNESINGNRFTYLKLWYQLFIKRKFSKGRLELHNPDIDGNPRAVGLLPFQEEWHFECPNKVYHFCNFYHIYSILKWNLKFVSIWHLTHLYLFLKLVWYALIILRTYDLMQSGTYVKTLCVGKDLWPCGSMANILTRFRPKY